MEEHIKQVQAEFQDEHDFHEEFEELQKPRYIASFAVYATFGLQILTTIIVLIMILLFASNTSFIYTATPAENTLITGSNDVNSVVVIKVEDWEQYSHKYDRLLIPVYEHSSGYYVLTNQYAENYNETYFEIPGYQMKQEVFEDIFDGVLTEWSAGATINVYVPTNDIPAFANAYVNAHPKARIQEKDNTTTPIFESMVNFVCYVAMIVPLIFILKPSLKHDYELLKKVPKAEVLSKAGMGILYVIAAGFGANILSSIISLVLQTPNKISANQLAINNMLLVDPTAAGLMITSAVIIGPIVEELAFRKSIFGFIENQKTALITSSILFGLIHVVTELLLGDFAAVITSGLSYIAAGLAFGYIYMNAKKNIYVPILAHMGYNAISIILTYLAI